MTGGVSPSLKQQLDVVFPTSLTTTASRDILFGESGMVKGSSPVKYGSRTKIVKSGSSLIGSLTSKPICIELPDASFGTSSRKRSLSPSSDLDSEIEFLSPLTPLAPLPSSKLSMPQHKSSDGWSIEGLGNLVWIRVNQAGKLFDVNNDDENDYMWWPAKNVGMLKGEITVRLYGTLGVPSATICVQDPSIDNIRSLTDSLGRPRFQSPSSYRKPISTLGSPKKKQKRDMSTVDANWQAAVCEILRDKEDEDDGLPPIEFALSASSRLASASTSQSAATSPKRNEKMAAKQKQKEIYRDDDEGTDMDAFESNDSDWEPPEVDEMLEIPGELVLARDRADRKIAHWPAKLLAFVPPQKPKGKSRQKEPKYRLLWLDDTEQDVPRSWFYACHEPEFGTCEMGKFASDHLDNEDDVDNHGMDPADTSQSTRPLDTTLPRSPSPIPVPLPSLPHAFNDLSIRAQLAYIKPVLLAILNEDYAPARDRHDSFMKGGKARAGLGASAGLRGTIPPKDVGQLQNHLCDWCLRDEIRASKEANNMVSWLDSSNEEVTDTRHPLEHINNGASSSKSTLTGSGTPNASDHHSSKENIDPDNEGVDKYTISKELIGLRSSPALTDIELPPSPPVFPPTSSTVSLLSEDSDTSFGSQSEHITVEGAPLKLERQNGCAAYENLTRLEKINYCLNVLLPEAVYQLLLWRNGHRTSAKLLSDFEEGELHNKAEKLAKETDWVFDIVRLREIKVRQLEKQAAKVASITSRDKRPRTSSRNRRIPAKYHM